MSLNSYTFGRPFGHSPMTRRAAKRLMRVAAASGEIPSAAYGAALNSSGPAEAEPFDESKNDQAAWGLGDNHMDEAAAVLAMVVVGGIGLGTAAGAPFIIGGGLATGVWYLFVNEDSPLSDDEADDDGSADGGEDDSANKPNPTFF